MEHASPRFVTAVQCQYIGVGPEEAGAVDILLGFGVIAGLFVKIDKRRQVAGPMRRQKTIVQVVKIRHRKYWSAAQRWKQWVGPSMTGENTPPSKARAWRPFCIP